MGILVPNLIACKNDPDTYKRQIEESLNSFKKFESELFNRAGFGIKCRIERADSLLKRLEDLKIKMTEIGPSSTFYLPSKLISPSDSKFKILTDDFLENYQQNITTENILDMEYERLWLLKDEVQSIEFSESPERVNVNTFQLLDFKSRDIIKLDATRATALSVGQMKHQTLVDDEKLLSESCSTSSDSILSEDLTDQELSNDDENLLRHEHTSKLKSTTYIPPPPLAPPLPPPEFPSLSSPISKDVPNNKMVIKQPQAGRANLLASIREGTQLKRVKSSETKKPADSDLMSTLAAKLQTRRNKIVPLDDDNSRPTSSSYNTTDDESWA